MSNLKSILGGGFNANEVEPQAPRTSEPLPAGQYDVEITKAEVRELKSGNGTGLAIEYTVVSPEQFARRKVFQNLNIKHTNAQAEQIGQSQLSALCRAVNIGILEDSDDLFQRMLRIGVKVRAAQGDYGPSNDVTGYEAIGAALPAVTRAAAPSASAGAAKVAPWKKQAA